MNDLLTIRATAAFVLFFTCITLNKQQVASAVFAVYMRITRRSALMAFSNNFIRNFFAHSLIKDKVLPDKSIFKVLRFGLTGVFNNSAFELENVFKALMLKPRRSFFASNTACAIHNNILVFQAFNIL